MDIIDKINAVGLPNPVSKAVIQAAELEKAIQIADAQSEVDDDDVKYVLTEWGCLSCVLRDYGFDVSRISGKVGKHIVEDFMELMCTVGYIEENPELEEEDYNESEH